MSIKHKQNDLNIAVIGLGYVGWPLVKAFSKHYKMIAYDHNNARVEQLIAETQTHTSTAASRTLQITTDPTALKQASIYVIAVPTPVDLNQNPDLKTLKQALKRVADSLCRGDLVIIESTLYPGACEDYCTPILEDNSGLKLNQDFSLAYCPERINPGDPKHQLSDVSKLISASNIEALNQVKEIYSKITSADIHQVSSIRVAESAKIIENTQRDLNIALMNELSIIFRRLGIDTEEVLEAAASKWNFHRYQPGLVGGHCIGVDPYYLTHKALRVGHQPDMILAGRRINDSMSRYIANRTLKLMTTKGIEMTRAKILVMGITYKENHADARNSKVTELIQELTSFQAKVDIYDPIADPETIDPNYRQALIDRPQNNDYDAILIAVSHKCFKVLGADKIHALGKATHIVYDVKWCLPADQSDERL